jgi:hypothetical protein
MDDTVHLSEFRSTWATEKILFLVLTETASIDCDLPRHEESPEEGSSREGRHKPKWDKKLSVSSHEAQKGPGNAAPEL